MGRPREHLEVKSGAQNCLGVIQGVYVRKGAGSGRWIKLGDMCLRCHDFWAVDPTATAEQIVAAATDGEAYLGVTNPPRL